jgi:hypothetical protein
VCIFTHGMRMDLYSVCIFTHGVRMDFYMVVQRDLCWENYIGVYIHRWRADGFIFGVYIYTWHVYGFIYGCAEGFMLGELHRCVYLHMACGWIYICCVHLHIAWGWIYIWLCGGIYVGRITSVYIFTHGVRMDIWCAVDLVGLCVIK